MVKKLVAAHNQTEFQKLKYPSSMGIAKLRKIFGRWFHYNS